MFNFDKKNCCCDIPYTHMLVAYLNQFVVETLNLLSISRENINSETDASELLENLKEMFPRY